MTQKFRTTWFCASLATYTTQQGGIFGKKEVEHFDPKMVNLDEFALCLAEAYEEMDAEGYDVINVVPITIGGTEPNVASRGEYLGEVGFTPTRAAVIVGKKKGT